MYTALFNYLPTPSVFHPIRMKFGMGADVGHKTTLNEFEIATATSTTNPTLIEILHSFFSGQKGQKGQKGIFRQGRRQQLGAPRKKRLWGPLRIS